MIDPIYDDGRITLYHANSFDVLPHIEARHGRPKHTCSDPPYSERTHANARTMKGGAPKDFINFASTDIEQIRAMFTLANAERWTISFADQVHAAFLEIAPPDNLRHMRTGVWTKPDGTPQLSADRPAQTHESIVCLHTLGPAEWNSGGKRGEWRHGVERDIPWHPTPKPVALLRELLLDFTLPDELIVDPYCGSGAWGVAARFEGRRAVLIDMDEKGEFIHMTAQRLREGRARPVNQGLPPPTRKQKNQIRFEF